MVPHGRQRLLRGTRVEELLHVGPRALAEWDRSGLLPVATYIMAERHYAVAALDELLGNHARNFTQPPTVGELLSGQVKLLPTAEAMAAVGVSDRHLLSRRIAKGQFAAVKLPGNWLYCAKSLERFAARTLPNRPELFTRHQVGHVLGVGKTTLLGLIASGRLATDSSEELGKQRPVTRGSLLGLLAELLPPWIPAEAWLEDRLECAAPLLTEVQVVRMLQVGNARGLKRHIDARSLLYVGLPKGMGKRFLPESVWGILEREPRVTHAELACMFGVGVPDVAALVKSGELACPVEEHPHGRKGEFNRICVLAMLRARPAPGVQAAAWYRRRLRSPQSQAA